MVAEVSPPPTEDYVVVELRHDSRVAFSEAGFGAPAEAEVQASKLNRMMEMFDVKRIVSHFGIKERALRVRSTQAPPSLRVPVSATFAHSGFAQILAPDPKARASLLRRLRRQPSVWQAFPGLWWVPSVRLAVIW